MISFDVYRQLIIFFVFQSLSSLFRLYSDSSTVEAPIVQRKKSNNCQCDLYLTEINKCHTKIDELNSELQDIKVQLNGHNECKRNFNLLNDELKKVSSSLEVHANLHHRQILTTGLAIACWQKCVQT